MTCCKKSPRVGRFCVSCGKKLGLATAQSISPHASRCSAQKLEAVRCLLASPQLPTIDEGCRRFAELFATWRCTDRNESGTVVAGVVDFGPDFRGLIVATCGDWGPSEHSDRRDQPPDRRDRPRLRFAPFDAAIKLTIDDCIIEVVTEPTIVDDVVFVTDGDSLLAWDVHAESEVDSLDDVKSFKLHGDWVFRGGVSRMSVEGKDSVFLVAIVHKHGDPKTVGLAVFELKKEDKSGGIVLESPPDWDQQPSVLSSELQDIATSSRLVSIGHEGFLTTRSGLYRVNLDADQQNKPVVRPVKLTESNGEPFRFERNPVVQCRNARGGRADSILVYCLGGQNAIEIPPRNGAIESLHFHIRRCDWLHRAHWCALGTADIWCVQQNAPPAPSTVARFGQLALSNPKNSVDLGHGLDVLHLSVLESSNPSSSVPILLLREGDVIRSMVPRGGIPSMVSIACMREGDVTRSKVPRGGNPSMVSTACSDAEVEEYRFPVLPPIPIPRGTLIIWAHAGSVGKFIECYRLSVEE